MKDAGSQISNGVTLSGECDVNAQNTTSGCVCNPGFIDIRNTSLPDGKLNRKSGMKCIAIDPCGTVSQPQSIIFIMDSSGSVRSDGWANPLSFMEKAAPLVPKNSRVGFIKYSTKVTANLWDDPNQKSTVVLLTDGKANMPSEMPAALDKLKKAQGKFLAVGFGNELQHGRTDIEGWLDNPTKDYFAYQEETSLLTADHMKFLRKFVKNKQIGCFLGILLE